MIAILTDNTKSTKTSSHSGSPAEAVAFTYPPPPSERRARSLTECSPAKCSSSGNLTPPLSPPWHTESPADPSHTNRIFSNWPPTLLTIKISGRLVAEPKTHQKTHPSNTSQKFKKLDHGRPVARFWWLVGTIWVPIFLQFSWPLKPLKLVQA